MARKEKRNKKGEATFEEIPMTPMIDVVFQLLIYFILTFEPVDVMAFLDVFAPSPEAQKEKTETPPNMIRITIYDNGYTINDRQTDLTGLERVLSRLGAMGPNQTVLIQATSLSRHRNLIDVLDICAKAELRNLSVVSTN